MQTAEQSAFCSYNTTIAEFKRSFAASAYVTYSTWEKLCHTSKREENTRWIYYSIQGTLRHIHHVAKWHTTYVCHIMNYIQHNRQFAHFARIYILCAWVLLALFVASTVDYYLASMGFRRCVCVCVRAVCVIYIGERMSHIHERMPERMTYNTVWHQSSQSAWNV